jgi:hypothetical protein
VKGLIRRRSQNTQRVNFFFTSNQPTLQEAYKQLTTDERQVEEEATTTSEAQAKKDASSIKVVKFAIKSEIH